MELIKIVDGYKLYQNGDSKINALDGITVTIKKGEFVAIVGSSGSGKSTLMNILGCLDVLDKGEYILDGVAISKTKEAKLSRIRSREIGFIFQGFNLISTLTARENVELPLIYRKKSTSERNRLTRQALNKVGLWHRRNHKPSEMSGGQQQRVAIARAIADSPPIILADEPTGNLDSKSAKLIIEIVKTLHREGKTIVLITHDMEVAKKAERIIKISDGKAE